MAATVSAIQGALAPTMSATGMKGPDTPTLSKGIAIGVANWIPRIAVRTADTGSLGRGTGGPVALPVSEPEIFGNILAGDASQGLIGERSAPFTLGIAKGLTAAFLGMVVNTQHPNIGRGTASAWFQAPVAWPYILQGLHSVGLHGEVLPRKARAVGFALNKTFASLALEIPIVGSFLPLGGSGVGFGKIT
jgi:hypothetical protein